jgi:hypothetical protein
MIRRDRGLLGLLVNKDIAVFRFVYAYELLIFMCSEIEAAVFIRLCEKDRSVSILASPIWRKHTENVELE